MLVNRLHIFTFVAALVFGLFVASGCQPEKGKAEQAQELLADSSTRMLIEQKIAADHRMASQMMPMLMEHMDSMMASGVCMSMMGKAHSDKRMAEHMCDMMASDTMMSGMMRSKMGCMPMTSSSGTDHSGHHSDASTPKPKGHSDHPAIRIP